MENQLWKIFDNINTWLQFSEKKNSFIVTIIATQLTLIKLFSNNLTPLSYISLFFLMICLILTIISFFPKTAIDKITLGFSRPKGPIKKNDNLIFFADIAQYSKAQYIKKVETTFSSTITGNNYLESLCEQIIVNSKIILIKLKLFKISIFMMIIGQFLLFLSLFF